MGRLKGSKNGILNTIEITCETCGKVFSDYVVSHRKYCSIICRPQHFHKGIIPWCKGTRGIIKKNNGSFQKGRKNINWKHGRCQNYYNRRIFKPKHPRANKYGYIPRYIENMEQHLGRQLKNGEIVHHINKIKIDDKIENLILFPNTAAHMKHHAFIRKLKK